MKDFLDDIDRKVAEKKANDAQARATFDSNRDHLKEVIARLRAVTAEYKAAMKQRSMDCTVQTSETSIAFEMRYRDGGYRKLFISGDLETNRIKIIEYFTNDDGKNYSSTDGSTYDQKNWQDDIFTRKLESCIKDFIFYADRHSGY